MKTQLAAKPGIGWTIFKWFARLFSLPGIIYIGGGILAGGVPTGFETSWADWVAIVATLASVAGLIFAWWREALGGAIALVAAFVMMVGPAGSAELIFFGLPALLFLIYGLAQGQFGMIETEI